MSAAPLPQKLKVDKSTSGDITYLSLSGVLAEGFEGRKLAESIRTKKVVVSMRDVRRFASWGMSEWMDFLRVNAERDLYLVECSTYAVQQINLVTGLLGHGKLVSFYTPYRCGGCNNEIERLVLVPAEGAALQDLVDSTIQCPTCGGSALVDKYPAAILGKVAERAVFDVDDDVIAFLRAQFGYNISPDASRFRAHRRVTKDHTYIRLSGNLAALPAETLAAATDNTTVVDLAAVSFSPSEMMPWRTYVRLATARASVGSVQLLTCPIGFLEYGVGGEELRTKLKVRSFAVAYYCAHCQKSIAQLVDVAENLEHLIEGIVPASKCPTCQATIELLPSNELASVLRQLPARERDPNLDKFLAKVTAEPATKLEDCLTARTSHPKAPGGNRMLWLAAALAVLILGGLVVVAIGLFKSPEQTTQPIVVNQPTVDAQSGKPIYERPDWIVSDVPSSAFCHDMINRLMCVGVSSFRPTRNDAVTEAKDAALEELVITVGLKITNDYFQKNVLPAYSSVRSKALAELQNADTNRNSAAYTAAHGVVSKARKRVVEIFEVSGGPAVPVQRSDWYWEEYAIEKGSGTEVLVFVRYDVSVDALKTLVERYSANVGTRSTAMTAFPALAWKNPEFVGGALLTKVGKPLAGAVTPPQIVTAIGDLRIVDADGLAQRLADPAKATKVTVLDADGKLKVIELKR